MIVPNNSIAIFVPTEYSIDKNRLKNLIEKCPVERQWFTKHFYRCLPLSIANQYGYYIKSEWAFSVEWNGGNSVNDLDIKIDGDKDYIDKNLYPHISSHFGHGIFTVNMPFILRTPPNVNLLTINPPNIVLPNITVMSGAVETDNLRRDFTFNIKVQMPHMRVHFAAGSPLAAFIPIPRFYADSFDLKFAEEIFSEDAIIEELEAAKNSHLKREFVESESKFGVGMDYYKGQDVYGNKFQNHQNLKSKPLF